MQNAGYDNRGLLDKHVKLYIDTRRKYFEEAYPEVWRNACKICQAKTVLPEDTVGLRSSPFAQLGTEIEDKEEADPC